MMRNTIITEPDIELYVSKLDVQVDEYINSLPEPNVVFKAMGFQGLLLYIYEHMIVNIIDTDNQKNDYDLLDYIFRKIYCPLCYRFNIAPTILGFSNFVCIDNTNLTDVKNGYYRSNGSKPNIHNTQTVKKWYAVCEQALLSKCTNENSIGSIFALKANYGYSDQPKQIVDTSRQEPLKTLEELQAEYCKAEAPIPIDFSAYDDSDEQGN